MLNPHYSSIDDFLANQYARLLLAEISVILIPTLFSEAWSRFIYLGLQTLVIILIIQILRARRVRFYAYLTVVMVTLLFEILQLLSNSVQQTAGLLIDLMTGIVHITFMVMVIVVILKKIFSQQAITQDSVLGGVSVYLLLGFGWFFGYQMLYELDSHSFNLSNIANIQRELAYFSFVTLTTVGYGDVTPQSSVAMALAVLEALMGQMYPAIIISCLISQYLNTPQPPRT